MTKFESKRRFFNRRNQNIQVKITRKHIIVPVKPISFIVIFFLFITSLFLALRSDIFIIHNLEIVNFQSNSCITKQQLYEDLSFIGRSLIFLEKDSSVLKIKNKYFCIKDLVIIKKWPDKIYAEVIFREPLAAINIENIATNSAVLSSASPSATISKNYYLIDNGGVIYENIATYSANLPLILIKSELVTPKIGNTIETKTLKVAVEIIKKLIDFQIEIVSASIENDQLTIYLKDETIILFSLNKEANFQASSLQAIIRQSKIDGKKLIKADLRFNKPVVVFK
jgi:hypothetical protein